MAKSIDEETRLRAALSIVEQLAAVPVDPQPHVFACICDRIPRAPDPDVTLFSPAPA